MKIKNIFLALLATAALTSCVQDLLDTNKNPNEAQIAQPDYLLTNAIKSSVDTYWGTTNNLDGTLLFAQHVAKIQYTEIDRYIASNTTFESPWKSFYSQGLRDLAEIIKIGETENQPNYKAVATIFRSWVFLLLTDAYGDIPYSQAININEYITPAYDAQKDVYHGLLNDLKTAVALIDPTKKAISGDVIYSGNLTKWKKFANSLRYRIALRIADKEPEVAKQAIAEIPVADLIGDGETAQLVYLTSPNQNPIALFFETRDDYRVSKSIVETLKSLNDPRLPVFANKTETATPEIYIGVPNGLTTSAASALGFSKTSKIGTYFTSPQTPGVILSTAEVLFGRAEAAARGFTTENAETLYNQAIKASLKQFGITSDDVVNAYLAQPSVKYNSANYKQSIGVQKWIALFGQGLEAFAEWRRLDYPQLPPAVAGTLDGKIPVRYIYPGSEQSLNLKNYKAAVARQGADALTIKLWFDVN
ncbi:hypothetical protein AQPE_4068 [Aquipluma nitroreducens]|uniref:SusD/RagB family nutrient-binding outer membrane lipoprotein n=1 Tax=Aquipluma nitroreducens TaxID=2010828 RepID=A0A5K7SE83_9BACT|nr:SusD/RagB family nutrient-binding outer membrane lipoprotein [Aquipluma nitroreducens]BBE19880.1 hypothetical protein AQPE_4068 [Aquipluma nitroreducens]